MYKETIANNILEHYKGAPVATITRLIASTLKLNRLQNDIYHAREEGLGLLLVQSYLALQKAKLYQKKWRKRAYLQNFEAT